MKKPIKVSIDTTNSDGECLYENIRKGETLSMTIKIFQGSASLDLTGQKMHIVLQKPDGYSVEKIIQNVVGNQFVVDFDLQATLAVGDVEGIIEISDSAGTNITNIFSFEVKANPSDNIVIKSADQIETLQQIIGLIDSYNENADNLAIQNELALAHETTLTTLNIASNNLINTLETDISIGETLDITLKSDISIGNALDTTLKSDFVTGNALDITLKQDITNANIAVVNLNNVNWPTIQSYIDLMNIMLSGMTITDQDNEDITDENDIEITM